MRYFVTSPDGDSAQYVINMRYQRNRLLAASDWTALPDNELTDEQRQAWAEYRSALRHFPETWTPSPTAEFPDPPEAP